MRNKILAFLLIISGVMQAQHSVNFREGSATEIMQLAKKENKPVFYMFYASWCAHCNKMKAEVMTDSLVADFYNKNFICAKQDMEAGPGIELRQRLNVKTYPTFVFFNTAGEVLYRITGEFKVAEFILEGQNALDPKKQFTNLKTQFLADVSNADNALAYISAFRKAGMDSNANDVAKKYLATQTEAQLVSAMNWKIIANGLQDIDSREFQYVLKNQKEFAAVSSPIRVEKKIVYMVNTNLSPAVEASDTIAYFKKRPFAAAIHLAKTDSLIFNYDIRILENTKNWKAFRKATSESVPKYAWKNAAQLKEIAMAYMNNITDNKALKDAIAWAERSLELKDSYDVYIILARLNLKTGNKSAAKDWAEKGKKLALSYQWDTKQADEIINQIN
ncbi:MAG TPA: thioredoxin family protein [Flavobacterium sp.]|nr:thioredoxin family protein [Flavobacterium sp.]